MIGDLRFAFRLMRRNPGTTLASFLALMLGIGSTTAIFSILNGLVLRSLPVADADRLVRVYSTTPTTEEGLVSMADFVDWRGGLRTFSGLSLYGLGQVTLTGYGAPERVIAGKADGSFFQTLGVNPLAGRVFRNEETRPGNDSQVILGWQFWQSHFGGGPVLGARLMLDEKPYTVIGVLPKNFTAIARGDIWLPLVFDAGADENKRGFKRYLCVGRLASRARIGEANAELASFSKTLAAAYPEQNKGVSARAVSLENASTSAGDYALQSRVRPVLWMLFGAVGLVLVIACLNVANISLARALSRERELAVRVAMGSSRVQLLRQGLLESLILSVSASLAGVGLAAAAVRIFRALPLTYISRLDQITVDWHVLAFAAFIGISTGAVFGVLPVVRAIRTNVANALRQGSGRTTESRNQRRTRRVLVGLQTALAAVLLIESALLIKSFVKATAIRPAMSTDHLLTAYLSLPSSRYSYRKPGHVGPFVRNALDRIRSLPGVRAAAVSTDLPYTPAEGGGGVLIQGQAPEEHPWNASVVLWTITSPEYFRTMQIPLLKGVDFTEAGAADRDVIVVNQAFVKRYFNAQNPIGQQVAPLEAHVRWREIIGVAADVTQTAAEKKIQPQIYLPIARLDPPWLALVVRTSGEPSSYLNAIRTEVAKTDGAVALFLPRTMEQVIARQFVWRSVQTWTVGAFAAVSLTLACIGIYAVIAYSVDQQSSEIGVRGALGASSSQIIQSIIWLGTAPAVVGTAAGMVLGFAAASATSQMLFGVQAGDLATYAAVAVTLLFVSVIASYFPARRAAAIDPWQALRHE